MTIQFWKISKVRAASIVASAYKQGIWHTNYLIKTFIVDPVQNYLQRAAHIAEIFRRTQDKSIRPFQVICCRFQRITHTHLYAANIGMNCAAND